MNGNRRRFTVLIGSVLMVGFAFTSWASADTTLVPTGTCARSYTVVAPTTLNCSFTVSSDSISFSGWTSTSWTKPVNANALEIDVNGQPQPLNTCVDVNGACGTTTFGEDLPAGTVISCQLRVVTGSGSFACESDAYSTG